MLGSYTRHVILLHTLTLNHVNTTAARLGHSSTYRGTNYILPQCDPLSFQRPVTPHVHVLHLAVDEPTWQSLGCAAEAAFEVGPGLTE